MDQRARPPRRRRNACRNEIAQELVVIAGDVDDAGALAPCAGASGRRRCAPAANTSPLQLPAIDDVADEVDGVGVMVAQEIEEQVRLATFATEMEIGQEERAK